MVNYFHPVDPVKTGFWRAAIRILTCGATMNHRRDKLHEFPISKTILGTRVTRPSGRSGGSRREHNPHGGFIGAMNLLVGRTCRSALPAGPRVEVAWLVAMLTLIWSGCAVNAGEAKITKVLPHYLDSEGRHSLSPSLFERDAYQNFLRRNPERRSGLQFDVQWKAGGAKISEAVLRLELRTSRSHLGKPLVLERRVNPGRWFSTWTSVRVEGEDFKNLGELIAWRATLRSADQTLAEQKSFLW